MNVDLNKTQFGKQLRGMAGQNAKNSASGTFANTSRNVYMDYSFQGNQGGIVAIPQSGLRHAVALEKLINSHESQDSVLRDLKEMVPLSKDSNSQNNTFGENFSGQPTQILTQRNGIEVLRNRRGKSVSVAPDPSKMAKGISPLRKNAAL